MTSQFASEKAQLHTLLKKSITTGFVGGIFWSVIWLMAYGMNMVKINPVTLWDHFFGRNLPFDQWYMYITASGLYSLLSIIFAVIYYLLFKRLTHWMMGFVYGVFIWALLLFGIPLLFNSQLSFADYSKETMIGLACIAVLYGLFIGYTISFDYRIMRYQERNTL